MLHSEKASYIHGDVTRPNVLVNDTGVYLVDWEFTHRGSFYYEIAKTLNNIANFSITHIHALLTGYERIRPFHPEERLIIASLFRLPREAWVTGRQIQMGRSSDVFARLKESWLRRIEAIQWIDLWAESKEAEVHM